MRLVITMFLAQALGVAIAFGLALFVGHWFPSLKVPVFVGVAVWWLWTGWRYAKARDRNQL